MTDASTQQLIERLGTLCLALPGVEQRESHGEPAWFVRGKWFVTFADRHHDDRIAFWAAAPDGAQEALIDGDPVTYFRPPYVGHRGWIGVRLDGPTDWDAVALHVRQAHATVGAAPTRRIL